MLKDQNKKNVSFYSLGIFLIINTLVWTILSGGRWFEMIPPGENQLPEFNGDPNQVFGPFYMLAFFTIQTNFFTGITMTIIGFKNNSNKAKNWFFGSIVLITITFLVYWAILSWSTDDYKWSNPYFVISTLFTHGVNPIIGFVVLFMIKNEFVLDKKIIGWICLFMSIYIVFHSFFYSAGAYSKEVLDDNDNPTGKYTIYFPHVYGFLDVRKIFFMNGIEKYPWLVIIINMIVFLIAPLFAVGLSWIWAKSLRLKSTNNSYYKWMDKIKKRINNKKEENINIVNDN